MAKRFEPGFSPQSHARLDGGLTDSSYHWAFLTRREAGLKTLDDLRSMPRRCCPTTWREALQNLPREPEIVALFKAVNVAGPLPSRP